MLVRPRQFGTVAALAIGLAFPQVVAEAQRDPDDRARIVGSWRIVSYELEFQDGSEHRFPLGMHPNGYLVFSSDGRMMAYLEAAGRKAPQTDEERSAAYKTLNAYTGKYRVEGDKWITKVDAAWNVEWLGTDQERFFTLSGNRLNVVAQWNRNALYGGEITRGHLTFERET
jgi:hypothetical protein